MPMSTHALTRTTDINAAFQIGDVYGRKQALILSVVLMGASTLCIGCLPTYASMGLLATILLAGMRLMQGLSVGGEFVGSLVFAIESAPAHHRVLAGSLCTASATFGVSLGSWTGLLLNATFSEDEMRAFGWRLPFLGGVLIGMFAFWARAHLDESPQARSSLQARDAANAERSVDAEGAMDAVDPAKMPMYACMHACMHAFIRTNIQTHRQEHRQKDRQTDRQTGRQR